MDVSKRIEGVRYNLCQDKRNQVMVKKEKDVIMIQNLDHKLKMKDAFDMLDKVASGEYVVKTKRNEEKLNIETIEEETTDEVEIIEVPTPNPCLFCGGIPKIINLRQADSKTTCRALQCTGLNCTTSKVRSETTGELKATFKYWIYTVDVIDSVDKADFKLVTEWNKRMPLKKEA